MILKSLRSLHICSCGKAMNYSTVREARYLNKIMTKGQRKQRLQNNQLPSRGSSLSYVKETLSKKNIIRMSALSKIFMKHITEILETSRHAEELNKYGIEITKVLVTSDFNFINVFWTHSGKMDEAEANQILLKSAGLLRYELSVLKILGHVPEINFLKDMEQFRNDDLNQILSELTDFSEKYKGLNLGNNDVATNIEQIQTDRSKSLNELPVMSHNIFGLDHSNIMKKILLRKAESVVEKFETRELQHNEIERDKNSSNKWQFDKKFLSKIIFKKKYLEKKILRKEKEATRALIYDLEEHSTDEESDFRDEDEEYLEYDPEESQDK